MSLEKRTLAKPLEIRIIAGLAVEQRENSKPKMIGYAAVFNVETDIGGYFREKVMQGAFTDAIKTSDIHALFNHNENIVLGRAKAGTLVLFEDSKGLKVEIDPPDTQDARDLMAKMKRGDIDQMSFAFTMEGGVQTWDETGDTPLRIIEKVGELYDVSVVTRGAYPTTEVGLRSLDEIRKEKKTHNFNAAARRVSARKAAAEAKFRKI